MICPHCHRTIADHDEPLMAKRNHDAPLSPGMRRLGIVGASAISVLVLAFLFHLAAVGIST